MAQEKLILELDIEKLRKEASDAARLISNVGDSAVKEGDRIDSAMRKAGAAMAAYFSVQQLTQFAKSVIDVRGKIESLEISFRTLLGSEEKAADLFGKIRDFAVNTPMQLGDLAQGAQTMLGFGIEAEKVMGYLQQLGDISMGDSEKFKSLTLAFSQVSAAGKLQGQDLLQLINAGFNPLNEISKQTGKSISELKDEMSAGKITAEDLAGALASATGEGGQFFGMLESQSKGIQGALSNLQGAWDDMLNDIGSKNQSIFVDIVNGATTAVKNYEDYLRVLTTIIATYGTYKAALLAVKVAQNAATIAQVAFNAAANANPYVMVATVLVGAATAIYNIADALDDAADGAKKYADETKAVLDAEKERNAKANDLLNVLKDTASTEVDRVNALAALRKEYPKIFEKYDTENIKLADTLELLRQINAENSKRAGYKTQGNRAKLDREIKRLQGLNNGETQKKLPNLLKQRDEYLKDDGRKYAEQFIGTLSKVDTKTLDTYKKELQKRIAGKKNNEEIKIKLPIDIEGNLSNEGIMSVDQIKSLVKTIDQKKAEKNAPKATPETYGKKYNEAAKLWQKAKDKVAEMEKNKNSYTATEYEEAVKKEKEAREAFEKLGGNTKGTTTSHKSGNDEADKLAKETADYKRDLQKQTEEKKRAIVDQENELEQARIDAGVYGAQTEQKQRDLNFKKELEDIQRKRADLLQAKKDQARANFENNPNNGKNAVFDDSGISLSSDEMAYFDELESLLLKKQAKVEQDIQKARNQSMNEYLAAYGSYTQQMQAIFDLYEQQIQEEPDEGKKNMLRGQRNDEMANVQNQYNSSLENISSDSLQYLLVKLEEMVKANAAAFTPTQLEAYKQQIGALSDELGQRNPFLTMKTASEELKIAEGETLTAIQELTAAQQEVADAQAEVNAAQAGNDGSLVATNALSAAQQKLAIAKEREAKASNDVSVKAEKEQKAKTKLKKATNETITAANKLISSLKDVGDAIGGMTGDIIGVVTQIGTTVLAGIEGMKAASAGGAEAIKAVERASVILAIIGAALQVVTKIFNMVKASHDATLQKDIEAAQKQIEKLEQSYKQLEKQVEKTFSEDKARNINKQIANLQMQIGLINRQITDENKKKDTDKDAIEDYKKSINDIRDQISDLKEEAKDAIFGEDITSTITNFADAYVEAWSNGESKVKSAKQVVKDLMKQMVTESIKAAIQSSEAMENIRKKLQEFYADKVLTGWEQNYIYNMANDLQKQINSQFAWANSIMDDSKEQSSTSGGFATASQDSVDELNGRFTAMQMLTSSIDTKMDNVIAANIEANDHLLQVRLQTEESVNLGREANSYLASIERNTRELYTMNERLDKIEQNTRML